jgi:hypothetical protein
LPGKPIAVSELVNSIPVIFLELAATFFFSLKNLLDGKNYFLSPTNCFFSAAELHHTGLELEGGIKYEKGLMNWRAIILKCE